MADGEDGFGGVEQIPDTIERYVKIGTAGINLEDQVLDRTPGTRIIDANLMQQKIRLARNAAKAAGNPESVRREVCDGYSQVAQQGSERRTSSQCWSMSLPLTDLLREPNRFLFFTGKGRGDRWLEAHCTPGPGRGLRESGPALAPCPETVNLASGVPVRVLASGGLGAACEGIHHPDRVNAEL